MKKQQTLLFILMGLGSIVLCAAVIAVLFLPGGPLNKLIAGSSGKVTMQVYVQSPPTAEVGKEAKLIVTVKNTGTDLMEVEEIRLPKDLVKSADVTGIFPGTLQKTEYADSVGYMIGFMLEPSKHAAFEIALMPKETADILGDVQVTSGKQQAEAGFRTVFTEVVAAIPTETTAPTSTPTLAPTPTETATPVMIPYQAVVKLYAKTKYSSQLKTEWTGSGTIISPDGLILTNAHVVNPPNKYIKVDALVVSMTDNPDLPPVDKYYADVLIVDKTVDIAILRISKTIDFKPVDGASLNLPYVTMGDSDALKLGDPLLILGYPGIGGDTITLTEGDVSGFSSQKKLGERAFIKTAASITGGASGGLVMDRAGLIVAIPTQLGYGGNDPLVDCRVVADTNGDGSIDSSDICVPAGGYINAMRPIKFAIPLIMAAESMAKATETEASPSIDTTATLTSTLQATATLPFTPTVIATVVP